MHVLTCTHIHTTICHSFISLLSTEGFSQSRGGRPEAARLLVVVTDGESHDGEELPAALKACEAGKVTRYGIAVRLDQVQLFCFVLYPVCVFV